MTVPLVIQCGDHNYAPYSFVCRHLIENPLQEWIPIDIAEDDGREVDNDWVCEECDKNEIWTKHEEAVEALRIICIHCIKIIRSNPENN